MTNQTDEELFSELEAAVRKQQEAASSTHDEVLQTIQDLHDALNALEERENTRTQEAASWTDDAHEQLQSVRSKVDQSAAETQEAEGRLEAARARIQELEYDLKSLQALAKELDSAEGKIAQLERDLAERDGAVAAAEETQVRLTKMEDAYNDQAEAIEAGQAAKRRAAELETTLEEYKTAALADRERTGELEGRIEELSGQVKELEENLTGVESSSERIAELEAEHGAAREQLVDAEVRLTEAQDEAETLRRTSAELEERLSSQSAALEDAEGRSATVEEAREQACTEAEALRGRLSAMEGQEESLSGRAGELEKQLGKAEKRVISLESEIEKVRSKAKKSVIAQHLAETLKELEEAHAELEALRRNAGEDDGSSVEASADAEDKGEAVEASPKRVRYSDSRRRMGQILVEAGVVSEHQLEEALACQQEEGLGRHIGAVVVSLGLATEEVIARAVAHQSNVEYFDVDVVLVDVDAAHSINVRLAEMHTCIPIRVEDGVLLLAMENPLDLVAIEDIERASGLTVRPVVASVSKILECIDAVYDDSPGGN